MGSGKDSGARILVVDDEAGMRDFLSILLEREGHRVVAAANGREALRLVREGPFDLVISDIRMPQLDGVGLLSGLRKMDPEIPVVLITAFASASSTIEAMQQGAFDYVTKPFRVEEIKGVVTRALEAHRLRAAAAAAPATEAEEPAPAIAGLIGRSPKMVEVYKVISKVANVAGTVLITGESGTGKELVARTLHRHSDRAAKPFMAINCGAIPEQLLESELFGHVKGAFTGAVATKAGLFEAAHGGSLFLDEVGEMSLPLQVKLLRVLQDRAFRRVGGTEDIGVDVRVIAATNKHLPDLIRKGAFREDLYYRLNVIPMHLPPLRERPEDIPLLVESFVIRFCQRNRRPVKPVSPEAMASLARYPWPGNVRELENALERAIALEQSEVLTAPSLPDEIRTWQATEAAPAAALAPSSIPPEGLNLEDVVSQVERKLLLEALEKAGGVQTKAAQILGINFRSFRYRLKKYGLERPRGASTRTEEAAGDA
ncbi:MAG: sigma-54-dependent Fis family transcriptional regulator [candidate division NC10 bacterium]|nr:sigma-54-dependent Fis family transcriptional regulator [candidate division NC10 bacterium]